MSEHNDDTCPHYVMRTLLESEKAYTEQVRVENSILMKKTDRLMAEVERLEHQVNYWRIEAEVDNARWLRCLKDYEELRASSFVTAVPVEQYERVVNAGDAMLWFISKKTNSLVYADIAKEWNAAKQGKPSV